jgi:hypothetical protein
VPLPAASAQVVLPTFVPVITSAGVALLLHQLPSAFFRQPTLSVKNVCGVAEFVVKEMVFQ